MIQIVLFCGGNLLKQRIFWVSSTYLMILSGLGCLAFPFDSHNDLMDFGGQPQQIAGYSALVYFRLFFYVFEPSSILYF